MGSHVVLAATDFPLWVRVTHYVNLLFMFLLLRAGLQILMAHPRLYWNASCAPGSEWIKFTRATVPTDRLYTAMDDERPISPWLALPGKDDNQYYGTSAEIETASSTAPVPLAWTLIAPGPRGAGAERPVYA